MTPNTSKYEQLTLNVPVPYKYGTHQCVEPRFHALEPHLSRTSRALPIRVPGTRAAVRRCPRNSHSHASRGSAHFHAFAGRSSTHFHAIRNRSSAHLHAIISHALIPTHSRPMITVAPCIPTKLQMPFTMLPWWAVNFNSRSAKVFRNTSAYLNDVI